MMKLRRSFSCNERNILREIGRFVYTKNQDAAKASNELLLYGIHNIRYNKFRKRVIIILERPGIIIGKAGENIDNLRDAINRLLKTQVKIILIEQTLSDYLSVWSF